MQADRRPEQISRRMRFESALPLARQETIYQFVHSDEGRAAELWRHLASGRRRRRGYRRRKRPPPKLALELSIPFRPDVIAGRREFGPWEAALVHFRQKFGPAHVTTMVERLSRFVVILRNLEKGTRPIMALIAVALRPLPLSARRPVTYDRGSEFVDWPHLQAELGARTWFCDPDPRGKRAASRMRTRGSGAGSAATRGRVAARTLQVPPRGSPSSTPSRAARWARSSRTSSARSLPPLRPWRTRAELNHVPEPPALGPAGDTGHQ